MYWHRNGNTTSVMSHCLVKMLGNCFILLIKLTTSASEISLCATIEVSLLKSPFSKYCLQIPL